MDIRLIKIEETKLWIFSQAKSGRIFGVYVFDADNKRHFAGKECYEILFIRSEFETIPDDEKLRKYLIDGDLITAHSDYRQCSEVDQFEILPSSKAIPIGSGGVVAIPEIPSMYEYDEELDEKKLATEKLERTRYHFLQEDEVFHRFITLLSDRLYHLKVFESPKYGGLPPWLVDRVPQRVLDYVGSNVRKLSRLPTAQIRHRLEAVWWPKG
jgi:hypothetical protein